MNVILIAVIAAIVVLVAIRAQFQRHVAYEWNADLLYVNGVFERMLQPGRHSIFRRLRKIDIYSVRIAEQWLMTGNVDVTSADRLPFRMAASAHYRVTDAHGYHVRSGQLTVQKALEAALIEVAAGRKLEELLAGRAEVNRLVLAGAQPLLTDAEILQAQVDTVQLPPETRRLFTEIERARLEGLAALERARGEHASLRSLANAARMLKDNPDLMNLRLLQALGSTKGSSLVLGQPALSPLRGQGRDAPPDPAEG